MGLAKQDEEIKTLCNNMVVLGSTMTRLVEVLTSLGSNRNGTSKGSWEPLVGTEPLDGSCFGRWV